MYIQDDFRVRKGLTLSFGARYEAQTHLGDYNNIDPRAGITWAPFKSGRTTIRGSVGLFHQWLNSGTYEQTLRVDGFRQRDLTIINPTYPDPGTGGTVSTTSRYVLRGENLNAPVGGVRPDPAFANVIAVASDAEQRQDQLQTTVTVNLNSKAS